MESTCTTNQLAQLLVLEEHLPNCLPLVVLALLRRSVLQYRSSSLI